ncbi:phosphotransferase family protein [Nocardia sp. SC052]|uniref:phosphotransferase family protein n=1 Tax=Nocardia sichangensis TaxID=3385975 RepID=UPI0039A0D51D
MLLFGFLCGVVKRTDARLNSGLRPLSPNDALAWVRANGLVSHIDSARPEVVITRYSSLNESYLIQLPSGDGYFLKSPSSLSRSASIRHEAEIYRLLASTSETDRFVPDLVRFDEQRTVLALKAIPDAVSMDPIAISTRRLISRSARHLARTLTFLHGLSVCQTLPDAPLPPAYGIVLPTREMHAYMSPANLALARLVQRDRVLNDLISRTRDSWDPSTWIHGDLKWPNCLLAMSAERGAGSGVTLVDFEHSGRGDQHWDLGCIIAAFLGSWVTSISSVTLPRTHTGIPCVPLSLPDVQTAMRSFWHAYVKDMSLAAELRSSVLEYALNHAICRMVWSIFEACTGRDALPEQAMVTLQLAHNLAARPYEGVRDVLGLASTETEGRAT